MANFLFGVSGSISIYKTLDVISRLKKHSENVRVIMTEMATNFIAPLTFATFTNGETYTKWENKHPILHIDLARWADVFIVAPASANTISCAANGIANNLLLSTILAYEKTIYFVPAMNTKMYENKVIQDNIKKLEALGHKILEPDKGILACGEVGKGRYPDTENLYEYLIDIYQYRKSLKGKKILISAGPTKEDIDPVRYITNRSSGKMGYALALEGVKRGGKVTLVSGETNLKIPLGLEQYYNVRSAKDFFDKIKSIFEYYDIIIMAAAISDFTPIFKERQKIKKTDTEYLLRLKRTTDVLKYLGDNKKKDQILVGFAAETNNIEQNAIIKLKNKNLDLIVANDVSSTTAGFQSDNNAAILIAKGKKKKKVELCSKINLAKEIFDFLFEK